MLPDHIDPEDIPDGVYVEGPMVGLRVQWPKRGRGRGRLAKGRILAVVDPQATNGDAISACAKVYGDEYGKITASYFSGSPIYGGTERYFVASESNSSSTGYTYYAPSRKDVYIA